MKVAVVFLGVPKSEEGSLSGVENTNVLIEIDLVYTIYLSGDVVECSVTKFHLPPLPRVGVEFHLDKSVDPIKWADVRWVTFQNKDGLGIYASIYGSSPPMQLNASYYTAAELDRATHNEDLIKGDDIEVHLDHKHIGLAGSMIVGLHVLCPITPATSGHDIYKSQLQLL
ncbi:hypothetical protein M0R45_036625 [Rubus argutus]|uniref:beta-galactosidase n=1 Tax=Rubus argutus TaxID=59490 RepID=A0AAW1VZC6_RUBAR